MDPRGLELTEWARPQSLGMEMGGREFKPSQAQRAEAGSGLERIGRFLLQERLEFFSGQPTVGRKNTDENADAEQQHQEEPGE